jgi:hypothetical protein
MIDNQSDKKDEEKIAIKVQFPVLYIHMIVTDPIPIILRIRNQEYGKI